jgi:EmrB/QacA subfamily drug resistance transporter
MTPDTSALEIENNKPENQTEHVSMQDQSFFRKWGGLVVLSLALAIIIIDTTLLNVSLRTIINDLHTNLKSMQWVITIYSLILAAFTITGGRLGDLFGRKRMFLLGAIIFAAGSLLASLSKNIGMMISGEAIIEGIGAALMMPATASLLITNFKGRDRSIAFGVWGGIAAASSAIGPILGGWLTTNYSWRWGFRINIVVVAVVLIGSFLIKENHSLRTKSRIDFIGIILSSLGLLSVVFGFIQASTFGWFKAKEALVIFHHTINFGSLSATPVFILLGLIILTAFVFFERAYEAKGKTPLLSLHLFQNNAFVSGASTMAVLALGQAGLFFTIPVFLQAVRHLDALHTGLTLLPMSLSLLVAAPTSAFLNKFIAPKRLVQVGLALSVIAFIVLRATLNVDSTALSLAPGFIIFGLGMGLIMAQVSNLTLSSVSVQDAGEASGVNNTMRMVGQTLGSAILGAILLSALVSNVTNGIKDSKVIPEQAKTAIEQNVQDNVSSISFGAQDESATSTVPKNIRDELAVITNQSTVDANKTVMVYGTVFILLGLLVSTKLPGGKTVHEEEGETTVSESEDEPNSNEPVPSEGDASRTAVPFTAAALAESSDKKKPASTGLWEKILFGLIGAAVIILAIVYFVKSKNDDDNSNNNSTVTVESSPNVNSSANENTTGSGDRPDVSTRPVTENPQPTTDTGNVAGATTNNTPVNSPAASSTQVQGYNNSSLHFAFDMPSDWKIVKNSDGEVVFKSPAGLYNVQSYDSPGSDWDSLRSFLEQQSGISNVRRVMFGSRDLFQFDSASAYQTGYAFIEQGRLYYVLGTGSENTPLVNLKTF